MQVMGSQKVRKEEKMAYGMFGLKTHFVMPPISWMSDSPDLADVTLMHGPILDCWGSM